MLFIGEKGFYSVIIVIRVFDGSLSYSHAIQLNHTSVYFVVVYKSEGGKGCSICSIGPIVPPQY